MKQTSAVAVNSVEADQTWEMRESTIHITQVGKTLVHYKHLKASAMGNAKTAMARTPVSLANKTVLEKYLSRNKAVLTGTDGSSR